MANTIAWAIWFNGNKEEKAGFCFWKQTGSEGTFYEFKREARKALYHEIGHFHELKDKRNFTIVKVGRVHY